MRNILIDCDPGHDDALAIITALASSKLNVLGISTIGGNQTLEKVTKNAKNILNFLDVKIPLAMGEDRPLVKKLQTGEEGHGDSGMDGPYFSENNYPIEKERGVLFLWKKIMASEEKVTIVALGPLTNIALLLRTFPEVKEKIECISLMGGGIDRGNCTPLAEFNIYVDPEAAEIVFQSGVKIIMSGLDVTERAEITVAEIDSLKNKGKASNLVYELLKFYNISGRKFGFIDSPLHDLCAVAYLINSEIFEGDNYNVNVITDDGKARGLTYIDKRLSASKENRNTFVLSNVNRSEFVKILMEALEFWDKKLN
ncbi:nucleoside hydrolase [Fusobacterium sp. HC1336]|uniref:nucleoside hydrolase n=1 Tax=Fusobacterium sp. HC1336 TaxID=3171169 RepID=UPI003F27D6F4